MRMNCLLCMSMLALSLALCTAHLCLLNPQQRGSMNGLNTAAVDDCHLLRAPCGDRPAETPVTIWRIGQNTTVVFQKNLNHWLNTTTGYFVVNLVEDSRTAELARVMDNNEASLHLYTVNVAVPKDWKNVTSKVQVQYAANNPDAPPNFFQCADVMLQY